MALNISALSEQIKELSQSISLRSVIEGNTAQLLKSAGSFVHSVKGKAAILKLDNTTVLQDGSVCGRTPNNNTSLGESFITVSQIKSEQNICPKVLTNNYFSFAITSGSSIDDEQLTSEFAKQLVDVNINDYSLEVEKLIWQGDKSLSGSNNMKYIDGFIKQATGATGSGLISLASTGTITKQLQDAYMDMPIAVRSKEDFRFFIGQDKYEAYLLELATSDYRNAVDTGKLFGTPAKIEGVAGLNDTGKYFAVRMSNMILGVDLENEEAKAEMFISKETNLVYFDIHSSVGVAFIRFNEVGMGMFA